ncbi:MAG TPA: hypothetical protein VL738_03800 [Dactylosporangium sp.]|jgi:hypothetical protein|nr:hypothetical protein [Dactylosporangium sp.]
MTALTVAGPAALDGLAGRTGLRRLTVVGTDVRRLPHLPSLTQVRFVACRLGDLSALLDAPSLHRRDLLFSAFDRLDAGDDQVLLAGAGGIVAGVPHSRSAAAYRAELGDVASQYERVQCVRLWRRTGAVFGAGVLVRPGPAAFTAAQFDAVRIAAAELERELAAPGFSLERVFARYSALTPPGAASLVAAAADPPGAALLRWAFLELWAEDRIGADRFAQRFPHVALRTDPPSALDAVARRYAALLPGAYLLRARIPRWLLLRDAPPLHLGRLPGRAWQLGLDAAGGHMIVGRCADSVLVAATDETECVLLLEPGGGSRVVYRSFRELLDDVTGVL